MLAGFALLILANGLLRRKRLAWVLTVTILIISVPVHLFKGLDYEEAILAMALAAWLIYLQPHFHARSDPPSIRQGLLALLGALVFTLVYGALGFYLLDRHFIINGQKVTFNLVTALRQTAVMFTQFYNPGFIPTTRFATLLRQLDLYRRGRHHRLCADHVDQAGARTSRCQRGGASEGSGDC